MSRRKLIYVGWLLVGIVGCGASGEDSIIADVKSLYEDSAAAVAKCQDLDGLKVVMSRKDDKLREIFSRAKKLNREQKEALQKFFEDDIGPSEAKLEKAFADFQKKLKEGPNPGVVIETSKGTIKAELYEKLAPETVGNFLRYVDDKFFDKTIFHRVIAEFMIQGGGFEPGALTSTGEKKGTRAPIINESFNGLTNLRGTLAMARTGDPDSATAQFFINVKDNGFLDRVRARDQVGYAVFGKVTEGMDVVDKIRKVETRKVGGHDDVPREDVLILSIRRIDAK